jgi:hypothetical protein
VIAVGSGKQVLLVTTIFLGGLPAGYLFP